MIKIKVRYAFSLIELLVVIAIIAIVAAIAVPSYKNYVQNAKITEAVSTISKTAFKTQMITYARYGIFLGEYSPWWSTPTWMGNYFGDGCNSCTSPALGGSTPGLRYVMASDNTYECAGGGYGKVGDMAFYFDTSITGTEFSLTYYWFSRNGVLKMLCVPTDVVFSGCKNTDAEVYTEKLIACAS